MSKVKSNITVKLWGGISKFTVLGPRTFLHWIKISGVKIRSALKKSYLFHELEDIKSWYCENYNLQKIIMTVSCFSKHAIADVW